jgi:aldehyde:ferredoxin oxidoreductase
MTGRPWIVESPFLVGDSGIAWCKACRNMRVYSGWLDGVPSGYSHCDECHVTFDAAACVHCSVCHETFSGPTAFAMHRVKGVCLTPSEYGSCGRVGASHDDLERDDVYRVWRVVRHTMMTPRSSGRSRAWVQMMEEVGEIARAAMEHDGPEPEADR